MKILKILINLSYFNLCATLLTLTVLFGSSLDYYRFTHGSIEIKNKDE